MSNDVAECDEDVEGLQAELADRDRLVAELTSRLEQAAEQLDRLNRSGAGRSHVVGGGGMPPELIEEQRALSQELQGAIQHWEEMQPTTLLARIEMQVGEVRDLIVERLDSAALAASAGLGQPSAGPAPQSAADAPAELSAYEAYKAGLSDDEPSNQQPAEDAVAASEDSAPEEPAAVVIPPVDPPHAIDVDTATPEELREALDRRDSYIAYLTRRLRAADANTRPSGSWSDLDNVPDDLRERLEELEKSLEDSVRMFEVETSLERARLGREANRLELLDYTLRRRAKQMGMNIDGDDDDDAEYETDGEETSKKRGWFGMFGKKDDD